MVQDAWVGHVTRDSKKILTPPSSLFRSSQETHSKPLPILFFNGWQLVLTLAALQLALATLQVASVSYSVTKLV